VTDVKVVRVRAFNLALEAIKKMDEKQDAYLMSDIRDLIPEPPKPLELRGPSWSAIARGAAVPSTLTPPDQGSPVTPQATSPIGFVAGEGPPPLEVGATVEYVGMQGVVVEVRDGPPPRYLVRLHSGVASWLTDRDLAK